MGEFLYGTELPTFAGGGGGGGGSVDRYDLAHAKIEVEAADTHTVPIGEQYIVSGALTITGALILDGTLVLLP